MTSCRLQAPRCPFLGFEPELLCHGLSTLLPQVTYDAHCADHYPQSAADAPV